MIGDLYAMSQKVHELRTEYETAGYAVVRAAAAPEIVKGLLAVI